MLHLNNLAVTNVEKKKKKLSSKRIEHKRNWNVGIPQPNHLAYVSIYIDVRRGRKEGRKTERLPLEAKIEAEIVEKEDETVSEIVEQKLKL